MKSLRTLILSKDDGRPNMVLSPNKTFPFPGNAAIGLIPFIYKSSLSALFGTNAINSAPFIFPLVNPAGET